jgi:hypothetical protein
MFGIIKTDTFSLFASIDAPQEIELTWTSVNRDY